MHRALLAILLIFLCSEADAAKPKKTARKAPIAVKEPAVAAVDPAVAHSAFVQGNYAQAVHLYSSILASPRLTPTARAQFLLNRGFAHIRMNRSAEALIDLRQAAALDPSDVEASNAVVVLQNKALAPALLASGPTPATSPGWGLLGRLPGRNWVFSTKKATMHVRYEWEKIGISMIFGGKDSKGHRIEGRYFIDPGQNAIRATYAYKGKIVTSDIDVAIDRFVETLPGKSNERETTAVRSDGALSVTTEKMKSKAWEVVSTQSMVPASEEMIASLSWPEVAEPKISFGKSLLSSLKEGAISGFRDGMTQGTADAAAYRVRQVTDTKQCKTLGGEVVKCP
jgi:hypothetical protein